MKITDRFIDTGKYLYLFADEVLVNCIECGTAGTVIATWEGHAWSASFHCVNCELKLSSDIGHWYGPVRAHGRQPCGYCGHKWLTPTIKYTTPPINPAIQLTAVCEECNHETLVKANLSRDYPADGCCDPHFGLPLRLTLDTRFGTVWSYNRTHLEEMSSYVSAKLRQRQNVHNGAMFSRLPKWMKVAKHRVEISRALAKLEAIA